MRKKNWLIGSVVAAAVVICGAVGINSVKAADTDAAKSAKDEFVYEQVGLDSYYSTYSGRNSVWLISDDKNKISVIGKDGTVYNIDNTNNTYGDIAIATSANMFGNYICSFNSDNKKTVLNFDGTYVFGDGEYHEQVIMTTFNGNDIFQLIDGDNTIVKTEDGTDITDKIASTDDNISHISSVADIFLCVSYKNKNSLYYDKDFNVVDVRSKVAQEGYTFLNCYKYRENVIAVSYKKTDDTDRHYIPYTKFYDYSLNEYVNRPPFVSPSAEDMPANIGSNGSTSYDSNTLFSTRVSSDKYTLEDDFDAAYTGVLLGYKVVLGRKTTYDYNKNRSTTYAMFDENGTKLLDDVMPYSRSDKLVVKEDGKYKIYKVSLKSESGETNIVVDKNKNSVADVVAKDVDLREIKDENGNKITVDDLDADAKAVIEQKFEFKLVAAENVIPTGTKLTVSKVVAGKEYAAAKAVTAEVAERVAVFNIDLLNTENVKVQPNGKLEITTDVPKEYDLSRVAVYRLSEDGTSYVKLESKIVDGKVVFETDHFSTYMIVEEKAVVSENPTVENPTTEEPVTDDGVKGGSVQTGDARMAGIIALIAVMTLAGVAFVMTSKKSRA